MAGQIIKRGKDTWLVRIFQGRDESGKRRYSNKTIRGTKKDADKYLTRKLRDKDLGVTVEPSSISLGKYLTQWLENAARARVRPRTFDDYESLLERYVRKPLGTTKLSNLRALDIQGLYKSM